MYVSIFQRKETNLKRNNKEDILIAIIDDLSLMPHNY